MYLYMHIYIYIYIHVYIYTYIHIYIFICIMDSPVPFIMVDTLFPIEDRFLFLLPALFTKASSLESI